jgi:hypothetical protein
MKYSILNLNSNSYSKQRAPLLTVLDRSAYFKQKISIAKALKDTKK